MHSRPVIGRQSGLCEEGRPLQEGSLQALFWWVSEFALSLLPPAGQRSH